jgi:hypothetical protein
LLDAFSILAIRAMILLYARRSSSLGRNATARVLLFSAETKAAGEEEETRRRRSSKGTTEPMIGAPGLGLPQAVVEAINVVQGVGEWWKQPRPPAVALLLVGILLLLSLRSCCRYARTLTDELVLYLLSSLLHCKPLRATDTDPTYGVEINPLRALVVVHLVAAGENSAVALPQCTHTDPILWALAGYAAGTFS